MVKKCLKKLIGSERLLFMEISTVLFGIENVLNDRSLCFMYDVHQTVYGMVRSWTLKINVLMRDIFKFQNEMCCG